MSGLGRGAYRDRRDLRRYQDVRCGSSRQGGRGGCSLNEVTGHLPDHAGHLQRPANGLDPNYAGLCLDDRGCERDVDLLVSRTARHLWERTGRVLHRHGDLGAATYAGERYGACQIGNAPLCRSRWRRPSSQILPTRPRRSRREACSLTAGELAPGTYSSIATYLGLTGEFVGSTSSPQSGDGEAGASSTSLTLSSSTTTYGSENKERLTATVSGPAVSPYATGHVIFVTGSRKLCSLTLDRGIGRCTLSRTELSVGSARHRGRLRRVDESGPVVLGG